VPCKNGCTKSSDGCVAVTIESPIPKMPDGHIVTVQGEEIGDLIVEAEDMLDDDSVAQCGNPMDFVNLSRRLLDVLKSQSQR